MNNLYIFISLIVGLLFGVIGFLFLVYINNKRSEDARSEANLIIENALKRETEILVEAKEKALNTLSKAEKELSSRKFELEKSEKIISDKNSQIKDKMDSLSHKEKNLFNKIINLIK